MTIRILVIDDHPMVRAGVRFELEHSGADLEIVGDAADVEGAIAACRALTPDVALLDVHLPGGNGGGGAEVASSCRSVLLGPRIGQMGMKKAALRLLQSLSCGSSICHTFNIAMLHKFGRSAPVLVIHIRKIGYAIFQHLNDTSRFSRSQHNASIWLHFPLLFSLST